MSGDQFLYAPEKPKKGLESLAEKLSLTPCFFGFHKYIQTGQGFMYNSYQCGKCGKEDFDIK